MSVDFNSVINAAIAEAAKRRMGATQAANGIVNVNSMDASGRSSELSMGDIATAIKSKNAKKHEDNKFISTLGKTFKVSEDEKNNTGVVAEVQSRISAIEESTNHSLGRQAEISQSLKSYQNDPFIK